MSDSSLPSIAGVILEGESQRAPGAPRPTAPTEPQACQPSPSTSPAATRTHRGGAPRVEGAPSTWTRHRPRYLPSSSTRGSTSPCVSTMYRTLTRATGRSGMEGGTQPIPAKRKPELVARRPNRVDSSRHHQGPRLRQVDLLRPLQASSTSTAATPWARMLAPVRARAPGSSAPRGVVTNQGVAPGKLTNHSDRGGPMIAKPVAHLLADLSGHEEPRPSPRLQRQLPKLSPSARP
jgi:hypothetical protein